MLYALGRIAENKGYDLLVAAMPTIVSRRPDARLVLAIGSKSPTTAERAAVDQLRQLADELGVAEHIQFDDHVADEDLADRYRAADVFVLCSRYEPFGMTAVEAMACGTPTVVTNQGGLWHNLTWGRDALTVDPRDPEAMGHTVLADYRERPAGATIGALRCGNGSKALHLDDDCRRTVAMSWENKKRMSSGIA